MAIPGLPADIDDRIDHLASAYETVTRSEVGQQVAQARQAQNLTASALAKQVRVSPGVIAKIETGRYRRSNTTDDRFGSRFGADQRLIILYG